MYPHAWFAGSKVALVVSPDYGYGDEQFGAVPAGATLHFGELHHHHRISGATKTQSKQQMWR